MKRARFIVAAHEELVAQAAYYANANPDVGRRFSRAIDDALVRATTFPNAGSPFTAHTRRVLVRGFPFSIHYRPEADGIVVFAVSHHSRRSDYWISRLDDEDAWGRWRRVEHSGEELVDVIANDDELRVTLARIDRFQNQVAHLRRTEANPSNYHAAVSGFLAEIDRMQLDVREYLATHPADSVLAVPDLPR